MKQILIFGILFGMVLIHAPKSFLHQCEHEVHHCHNIKKEHHSDQNQEGALFEAADCDLCLYAFQAIDTPVFVLVKVPNREISQQIAVQERFVRYGSRTHLQLRGPPQIVINS
jgi:hypothetical protein